jgi:hypothetical protein
VEAVMSVGPDLARQAAWKRRLREFHRSAETVEEFCDRARVSASSFYRWQRKLTWRSSRVDRLPAAARSDATRPALSRATRAQAPSLPAAGPAMSFLPIEITAATNLEVILPNGARVSVPCHDHELIRIVLAALTSGSREDRGC